MKPSAHVCKRQLCDQVAFRPEEKVLLYCARTFLDTETAARLRSVLNLDLDWLYLVQAAEAHGLLLLLHKHLCALGSPGVPPALLGELKQYCRQQLQHSLLLSGHMCRLFRFFQERGIPALPLKGPVLAMQIYQDLSLREFCDLDILVHKSDMEQIQKALPALGYDLDPEKSKPPHTEYHLQFRSPRGECSLEMHWAIAPAHYRFDLDMNKLWESRIPFRFQNLSLHALCPEYQLMHLCLHGGKHRWSSLKWICDVSELIRSYPDLKWEHLLQSAERIGVERLLLTGLLLAEQLLDARLPEKIAMKIAADPSLPAIAQQLQQWLFNPPDGLWFRDFGEYAFQIRARERYRDKIAVLWHTARRRLAVTELDAYPLASSFGLLRYLFRPVRLVMTYGFGPLRQWFRYLALR